MKKFVGALILLLVGITGFTHACDVVFGSPSQGLVGVRVHVLSSDPADYGSNLFVDSLKNELRKRGAAMHYEGVSTDPQLKIVVDSVHWYSPGTPDKTVHTPNPTSVSVGVSFSGSILHPTDPVGSVFTETKYQVKHRPGNSREEDLIDAAALRVVTDLVGRY